MSLQEPLHGKIRHYIAVVAEDGLVRVQEIFDVFQSSRCVQKYRFVAKDNRYAAPSTVRKLFRIDFMAMMGVHDEAIHADFQEMIHRVGDEGASPDLQKWLRTSFRQRPKPIPQPGTQDESRLEPSSFQWHLISFVILQLSIKFSDRTSGRDAGESLERKPFTGSLVGI